MSSLSALTASTFGINESQLAFGLEDLTTFALLVPLASMYVADRTAFEDLHYVQANNGTNKVSTNPVTQTLVLVAFILCIIRIIAHPLYNDRPWMDLIFSLAVWGIFLTVWILTNTSLTNLAIIRGASNTLPGPTPIPNDQQKICDLAKAQFEYQRNWAIIGFIVSTAYTAYGLFYTAYPFFSKAADVVSQ